MQTKGSEGHAIGDYFIAWLFLSPASTGLLSSWGLLLQECDANFILMLLTPIHRL